MVSAPLLIQFKKLFLLLSWVLIIIINIQAQPKPNIKSIFLHPPESAKPWTFWYWMHGAVSKPGITADLEAMKEIGLAGAYLMPIQDTVSTIPFHPTVRQLTPEWWEMVRFAMQESKRLNLKLAMHVSDGFALAGGPWITPELSMQKVVWTSTEVKGGRSISLSLPQPEAYKNYYKDIAIYAYPAPNGYNVSSATVRPKVTTSLANTDASFLATDTARKNFSSSDSCWIQYEFEQPFTCRSIIIRKPGTSFQSQRLLVQVSEDGVSFKDWERLQPARHSWQDGDADNTYAIQPVKARYFRFVYGKNGTEPGAEDLDAAKWKPSLKIQGIVLLSDARIHQYEAKNASVWRVAAATPSQQIPDSLCIGRKQLVDVTQYLQKDGTLNWSAPAGDWVVLRMGHTSTGHTNATGGAGAGLECDKFNPAAIRLQFDNWFGAAFSKTDPTLAKEVLKIFHVDSWEAGSQNWSPLFKNEFIKRRGYDPLPWLPCMAGIPVESAAASEKFLHHIRETIAELVNDVFYNTLAGLAKEKGCLFTAESVAPTMTSDGMLHYQTVDIPMGEFWLNSPTHDKPNDMLDAVSGAHIYGKNIVQAEAFTTVRMAWNEHPGMLKTLQDRNYALGVNRLVFHVFAHNPFLDRKPGVTLDGVGLYFQRDQTWWKQGKAWVDYATRCQALLQLGKPVVDIAVFTGEELPRRSILPDRLVPVLPGLFGKDRVAAEAKRLANVGEPLQNIPDGVSSAANMYKAEDWIDPLNGYQYDCLNPDVLMKATVIKGRIMLPSGANYGVLVLPGKTKMDPNGDTLSATMRRIIQRLVDAGAKVIAPPGMKLQTSGRGKVLPAPYQKENLTDLGIEKDLIITDDAGKPMKQIAWTHRKGEDFDIYFIANQKTEKQWVKFSLSTNNRLPDLYDAVTGTTVVAGGFKIEKGRMNTAFLLPANGSCFIILQKPTASKDSQTVAAPHTESTIVLGNSWQVQFDTAYDGPSGNVVFSELTDWSKSSDSSIRYYSGTAIYTKTIQVDSKTKTAVLDLGEVANIATVKVNGIDCGTVWTPPFTVDITKAIKPGENKIEIAITNTWHNAVIGDHLKPESQRKFWTTAPFRLEGKPLDKAGLLGPVQLLIQY